MIREPQLVGATIVSGIGEGRHFVALPWFREAVVRAVGFDPYPGTLNVRVVDGAALARWRRMRAETGVRIDAPETTACGGTLIPVVIDQAIAAAVIVPDVTRHPDDLLEVIAGVHLRSRLGRGDGDTITLRLNLTPKGGVMTLDDRGIQTFLSSKEVVVLATVQPSGAPLAMPMWFLHDRTVLAMISVDGLQKVRNLRRDPRVSVVAESGTRGDIRGVTVQGRVTFLSDSLERTALVERFHAKYDPDLARLWGGQAMPPNRVMFRIVPERVRSWGLGD